MARSMFGTGPKLPNGTAPPKLPAGSPSPKLPLKATLKATPTATALPDDTARRPKKQLSCSQLPPTPRAVQGFCDTSNASAAKAELPRQSSWESKQLPTSPKLLLEPRPSQEPRGSGENAGTLTRDSCGSSAASPAHGVVGKLAKVSQKAKSGTGSLCTSQEMDGGTDLPAGPSAEPAAAEDSKPAKLKSSLLASAGLEPSSTTSPPPAKKLALSAKKVSLSICPETSAGALCLLSWCLCWGQAQSECWVSCEAKGGQGEPLSPRAAAVALPSLWVGVRGQAPAVVCIPAWCRARGSGRLTRTEGWWCPSLRRGGLASRLGAACPLGRGRAGDVPPP